MTNEKREIDLLVLDAHGVVFTSSFRRFLTRLADLQKAPRDELLATWSNHVRLPAWTGAISEMALWKKIGVVTETDVEQARLLMGHCFDIGHAAVRLPAWTQHVPVWMLSNHRSEWLLPRIRKFGLEKHFTRLLISDKFGAAKPDVAAFRPILESNVETSRLLFVDDQQHNLDAAASLGFQVVRATPDAAWTELVDRILANGRQSTEQAC